MLPVAVLLIEPWEGEITGKSRVGDDGEFLTELRLEEALIYKSRAKRQIN